MVKGSLGMMGDMFGDMSFDEEEEEVEDVKVVEVEMEVVEEVVEIGYQPEKGLPVLVREIRERGLSFQLWPAAVGMCRYLEMLGEDGLRGKNVLELGAGTGVAGVMAARLGANVTLTDLPHVLHNARRNVELNLGAVEANGGSLDVQPLRWGVQEDAISAAPPDLILASDCVYYDTLFDPLMDTLKWLFEAQSGQKKDPVLLLAHLRRWKKDGHFFRSAAKWLDVEVVHRHPPPPNARIGVIVYKFTRKLVNPSR